MNVRHQPTHNFFQFVLAIKLIFADIWFFWKENTSVVL